MKAPRASFTSVVMLGCWLAMASSAAAPSTARADAAARQPTCPELPCSVNRNCSSTGVACLPDDRACTEDARSRDLEVKCEQECDVGKRLVYCPPDTGRGESKVVWLLLAAAFALAIGGSTLFWLLVLRKKSA